MVKRSTPILASLDKAKTIAFYTEKLGFNFAAENSGYLIFERDGIPIHLFPVRSLKPAVIWAVTCM